MRGRVLGYDNSQAIGVISGDDGNRYSVAGEDLGAGVRTLVAGHVVDFVVQENRALSVFTISRGIYLDEKNKWIAAALALFLGWLGVHKFYLGKTNAGIVMLLCSIPGAAFVIPALIVWAIAFIEAVLYLVKDEQTFYDEYVIGNRNWF